MSIPNLPVDFKDDILASSNTKRKYRQTANDDSTVSFEDVTNYSQEGSRFGAKEVNQTNTAINNIYDERILDLDELELVTEPGFFVDAKAVKESYDELSGKTKDTFLSRRYPPTNSGTVIQSGFGFSMTFAPEEIPGYEILAVSSYSTGHDNFVVASVTTNNITGKNTLGSSYGIPKDAYIELVYTKL